METFNFNIDEDVVDNHQIVVLLMDDQEMVYEGIKRMLADEDDIDLHYCSDPSEAITTASQLQPTIILQDLVLPGIDGMTLVRFYRGNDATKNIPIIVLSSKEDPITKRDAFQYGANDYLVKLPDKIELIARIRSHAKQHLLQLERNAAFFALREMQKQLEKKNLELKRLSSLDGLTGIANRRIFDKTLIKEWKQSVLHKTTLSLILIDIDFFKPYNDTYGHQQGDDCLHSVAQALSTAAHHPTDLLARYGGEEFVVIAPNTNSGGATRLAENLCTAIRDLKIPHKASKAAEIVTISLGIATLSPASNDDMNCMVKYADEALYKAKDSGRNQSITYQND